MEENYGIPYIRPFNFYVQHIIPLTYDDSLSYLEVLEKVKIKLNEVIANINSWSDMIKNYTDEQIALAKTELINYINQQDTELRNYIQAQLGEYRIDLNNIISAMKQLEEDYKESEKNLKQWVLEQLQSVNDNYLNFMHQVTIMMNNLKDLIYSKDALIYDEINKQVKYLEGLIAEIQLNPIQKVIDPTDWKIESIQTALDHMFYNLKAWALRTVNYDQLQLTAEEYESFKLSAWNYDYLAKWYLREKPSIYKYIDTKLKNIDAKYYKLLFDYSPFSGQLETLKNILRMVTQIIRLDALTAQQYDELELSATDYDTFKWGENQTGLTAFIYDWYGTILLPISDKGITAETYDNLMVQGWHLVTDKNLNINLMEVL